MDLRDWRGQAESWAQRGKAVELSRLKTTEDLAGHAGDCDRVSGARELESVKEEVDRVNWSYLENNP